MEKKAKKSYPVVNGEPARTLQVPKSTYELAMELRQRVGMGTSRYGVVQLALEALREKMDQSDADKVAAAKKKKP